jgi:hypothetical protein
LELKISPEITKIKTAGSSDNKFETIGTAEILLKVSDSNTMKLKVHVIDEICSPIAFVYNVPNDLRKIRDWSVEKNVLPTKPDLLIGIHDYWRFNIMDTKEKLSNGLHIASSIVGLMLSGNLELKTGIPYQATLMLTNRSDEDETLQLLNSMYSLENLGI